MEVHVILPLAIDYSYKDRLQQLGLLPLCNWHEYLDMIYIFKSMSNEIETLGQKKAGRHMVPSSKMFIVAKTPNLVAIEYK